MKKLFILGDSTSAKKREEKRPETGWGEKISEYMNPDWVLRNLSVNGLSTLSCMWKGVFAEAWKEAGEGDWAIMQFGHNDPKDDPLRHTDAWGSYTDNLTAMATALMQNGVSVIFLTSVPRWKYDGEGKVVDTHGDYPEAMISTAKKLNITCYDIHTISKAELEKIGKEKTKEFYMSFDAGIYENYPEGDDDDTHLRPAGAEFYAALIARTVKAPFLKNYSSK